MTIKKKSQRESNIEIDLTGPHGNAFCLMGYASNFCQQLGKDKNETDAIFADMQSSNYEHLLEVFEKHFGDFVIMYR